MKNTNFNLENETVKENRKHKKEKRQYITCMCLCVYVCTYGCVSVDTISVVVERKRVGQTVCAAMRMGCPLSRTSRACACVCICAYMRVSL